MKLKLLVAAIAVAAIPFAAQAEVKVSGDIMGWYDSGANAGDGALTAAGSEVNFDATDGIYSAHGELDFGGNGDTVTMEEMRIGVKLGNGTLTIGEVDNACDAFDPGVSDMVLGKGLADGACYSADKNQIRYLGTAGSTEYAISHNPGASESSVGARVSFGPAKVNLGYTDKDGDAVMHVGAQASFGAVTLGVEASDVSDVKANATDDDTEYSVMGQYKAGGNYMWAAVDDKSDATLGYARTLDSNTTFFVEADILDTANANGDDSVFAIGLKRAF